MGKDSLDVEEDYDVEIVEAPEDANQVYDSVEDVFHRINGWKDYRDAYHIGIPEQSKSPVVVRKYTHSSNRYYLTKSPSLEDNR